MSNNFFKWLYPGIRIKRWMITALLGVAVVVLGSIFAASEHAFIAVFGIIITLCGIIFIVLGTGKMIVSLITIFLPKRERDLVNILYKRRFLERGPKIVAIGGGHGLSNLLLSLKEYTANITAIVTVADNGGSSGLLREQFNIVAPGDIRNCLVALADAPALMGELFQYRFAKDSALSGHNFGNLFLTAMVKMHDGDFKQAVDATSRVLAIRGKVIPSTVEDVHLVAQYEDGTTTEGEAEIPREGVKINRILLNPHNVQPTPEAIEAINEAEVIILGPGSLYTSILPNLVISGVGTALKESPAFKIYVCNVMTQIGETDNYSASDHVKAILEHTSDQGIIDACIMNSAPIPAEALDRYQKQNQHPVMPDADKLKDLGVQAIMTDLIHVEDYVRHDTEKLTQTLISLIEKQRVIKR